MLVSVSEDLKWRYPLKGLASYQNSAFTYDYTVKAREILLEDIFVSLEGLNPETLKNEVFTISVEEVIALTRSLKSI